jgi:hypothetical protein
MVHLIVTPGLDPGVHLFLKNISRKMDCRVKPGNDRKSLVDAKLTMEDRGW